MKERPGICHSISVPSISTLARGRVSACRILAVLLIGLLLTGCSASSKGGKTDLAGADMSEEDLNLERERRFGSGTIPTAGEGLFRDIHFDYDSARVDSEQRNNMDFNVQILEQNPQLRVQLEGHCDERGTAEYNLALGSRRAQAVFEMLSSYGISPSRLETISYGEEVPLDPGSTETAWRKNRRVHFSAYTKK